VNGRLDVALASDADGVHLGGDAPPVTAIKPLTGQLWLGVSVHPNEDIPPEATYALLSPIFATRSKPGAAPLGLGALRDRRGGPIPVFALGGITQENAGACLAAGAAGVAVLGGVLPHPDPAGAAAALLNAISGSGA
jgi:thiamine-phosphate diphosphorylase